ncbi:SsgA family sporulation/cell division regulator [Streptomyces sp. NPDC059753]|uniref:SsgA family sporulation/cell division regulator n=1 Tax=Streptomyces sp. NPDC059753 TaxID=3346933 RepID=UPI00366539FD
MLPIAATFCYKTADPYAVQVTFHPGLTPDVVWFLERDLLLEGTQSFAGLGDVCVWPATGPHGEARVVLRLGSELENACFQFDRHALRSWLAGTESLVARGSESAQLDWTPFARLLADSC